MKVLVFPVLLAIAIITGPPKTTPDKAPATPAVKSVTAAPIAKHEPANRAQLASNDLATPVKDVAAQQQAGIK